tara:strand:+ start:599 stop:718 length:120 start_codon:yes stop_codon:yes gene_type:complete
MKTSQQGIDLIKGFEGCKLKAYVDPGTATAIRFACTLYS